MNTTPNNPFTAPALPFNALPFDTVKTDDYLPEVQAALEEARAHYAALKAAEAHPDFANTIAAMETADDRLERVCGVFYNLVGTMGDEAMHALAREISPRLAAFSNEIHLDAELFARVKAVYDPRNELDLSVEQTTVLKKHYKSFVRNGALLNETDQARLREIDAEASALGPAFGEQVLKATNAYALWVEDAAQLKGLPDSARAAAKAKAEANDRPEAWRFDLTGPSYIPFMTYCGDAGLREEMWRAFSTRCVGGAFDTSDMIRSMVRLRHERAKLLGYPSHAAFVLEERMAGSPEKVSAFYDRMLETVQPAALRDTEAVRALKEELSGESILKPWDYGYYREQLKQRSFDFDEEALRPWFALDSVVEGVFEHARRLFDLEFTPRHDIPVWHEEVTCYEVTDRAGDGAFIGLLYTDYHPRDTKRPGAWMAPLLSQGLWGSETQRPHVAIVCNFTRPQGEQPALLSLNEARTLFHEFGHALHALLSDCSYRSVAGTNVHWDFVELPSQLMENWLTEKESLDLFARHVDDGRPLPEEWIEKLKASTAFQAGYMANRQISLGMLDQAYYAADPGKEALQDLLAFEQQALDPIRLLEAIPGSAISHSFQHIFSGGYSAGYYSYKWSEVLDADAFEAFKENGLFDRATANSLRENILARGGSEEPMELYKRFRGREPDPAALMRRDGLV